MALPSNDINDLNRNSIIESTDVSGQPGIVVLNPDGTAVGAPVGGATASNQTDGSQKTQIVDSGGEAVTVTGGKLDVNATASLAGETLPVSGATEGVAVAIVDGSGNQITSFGGGTQYTEGDTDATLTGTIAMAEGPSNTATPIQVDTNGHLIIHSGTESIALPDGASNTRNIASDDAGDPLAYPSFGYQYNGTTWDRARGDSTNGLLVNLGSNNDVTVSGTVTANLGATDNAVLDDLVLNSSGIQSAMGTNSSDEASNSSYANWSTNTWTGTFEQNDYQYVFVNLQTDDAGGTLYFDFSQDGSNYSTFPVAGFTIATGVNEVHVAVKSSRYFRVRFVGSGSRTYFRLQTNYTNTHLELNSPLNTSMSADADGVIVKSAHIVQTNITPSSVADNSYDTPSITRHRQVRTRDQESLDLANCNDYTVFTTLGNDTDNLADSANHVFGTGAITFDKVNGAANTVFAGVQDTITSIDISELFESGGYVGLGVFLPSVTNLDYVFLRIGTDSSNYNEWRWDSADLTSGHWLGLRQPTNQPHAYLGNGWDTSDITYVSFGIAMNVETQTLSGVVFDNVHLVAGRVSDSNIDSTITSSVSTPNINMQRIGGTTTDTNTGNASAGTLRVAVATDDVNLAAQTTSLAALDNAVDGNYLNVNANIAGTDMVSGSGTATGALRVELPTNGTGVIATVGAVTSITNAVTVNSHAVTNAGTFVVQENGAALTSLQLIDDIVATDDTTTHSTGSTKGAIIMAAATPTDGSVNANDIGAIAMTTDRKLHVSVQDALPAGTNAIGKLAANSGVDIGDVDVTSAVITGGAVAHDGADSGNPIKIGFKAETSPKGITLVADGDRTDAYADSDGLQMVKLNTSGADAISERVSNTDGTSTAFTNFSNVASTKNYVTGYHIFRTDSGTTPIYVDFRDGTAGSILWTAVIPAGGGSNNPPYCGPCLFKTSAATALAYDVSAATTTVYISVTGYQSKV